MPTSTGEENIKPKRATKKRVPSKTAKKTVAKKPRKTAVKKTAPAKAESSGGEEVKETYPEQSTTRKAPTTFSAQKSAKRKLQINAVVVGVILLFGIGGSAVVGFTDSGPIDVNRVIEERNERVRNNATDGRDVVANSVTVPVQNTNNRNQVDGGLVGLGNVSQSTNNEPAAEVASSTATTSDATMASSSQEVASSTASTTEGEEVLGNEAATSTASQ